MQPVAETTLPGCLKYFGALKTESLHHYRFATREAVRRVVLKYLEVFYNRIRGHAKIDNQSPADCAKQLNAPEIQLAAQLTNLPFTKSDIPQFRRW
jgi:hypothetical protein